MVMSLRDSSLLFLDAQYAVCLTKVAKETMTHQVAFPIVGVGASAGGIEALEGFFRGLPAAPGLACVVLTPMSPTREIHLPDVIQRCTSLAVQTAEQDMQVAVNQVYVLPADSVMSIRDGRLHLRKRDPDQRAPRPIDQFFSSLAMDRGEFAAGVVLSGGDADGTLGVKAIKEHGGLTLAQAADAFGPSSPEMPGSAIASGMIDCVLPAPLMGARLVDFAARLSQPGALGDDADAGPDTQRWAAAKHEIHALLRTRIGHDFSGYKSKTFMRRVQRRMHVHQVPTLEAYIDFLKHNAQESGALFRDLLISVTNFFRDADAFEALQTLVIPQLLNDRGATETVRLWVPGCATGEEVYSLAILLREHMDTLPTVPRVQLFATDIDDRALAVARAARYPGALLDSVSPERRERYFVAQGDSFVVSKPVRDLCIFSPHSVLRDPPFSRVDLISCRNLLIYFGGGMQRQVIPTFHYALRPGGYLFLGMSDNVTPFSDLFMPLDKKHRIFQRRTDIGLPPRPTLPMASIHKPDPPHSGHRRAQAGVSALRQAVDSQVLAQHAPPHVLVNREGDVVYYSGRTCKYLEAAAGVPTRQVLTLARKGLRLDLRALLHEAAATGVTAVRENVAVQGEDGHVQLVTLTVEPLANHKESEPLFLILFVDQGPARPPEAADAPPHFTQESAAQRIESELRDTRERLQAMIEAYETALEELKSSNEALVSVNDAFQSTNEELEASKEELVSLNEALHTVNAELHDKVDDLDRSNSDLHNLFESTAIATLFLDQNLIIRSFTPGVSDVFHILPSDCGRPITDLDSRFDLPSFANDIAQVYAHYQPVERRIAGTPDGKHYLLRLVPYRGSNSRADGVVVTFIDITLITRAERRHRVLISELQHRTRNLLSRVQSLLSDSDSEQVEFGSIMRRELEAVGNHRQITTSGPDVFIDPERIQTLALAVHELATHAVKYGALRYPSGRLDVQWRVDQRDHHDHLILDWTESGLPAPPDATHRGYGRDLIEQALTLMLNANASMQFRQDGMACHIEMPLAAGSDTSANHT